MFGIGVKIVISKIKRKQISYSVKKIYSHTEKNYVPKKHYMPNAETNLLSKIDKNLKIEMSKLRRERPANQRCCVAAKKL